MQIESSQARRIVKKTRGQGHGGITRLMSPSDLGKILKPFVFLDIFDMDRKFLDVMAAGGGMGIHPHSGIATVTVFAKGELRYDDPSAGRGTLGYGGVEWMRAGRGVWHGKELGPGDSDHVKGFQLWIALPPGLETDEAESKYLEAHQIPTLGPARLILGNYENVQSPTPAPEGINYLLVTLQAGQKWTYEPPSGHSVAWISVAQGKLQGDLGVEAGELALLDKAEGAIRLEAAQGSEAIFVLGSAVPHNHALHMGAYSVHTSAEALEIGERHIAALHKRMSSSMERRTSTGTVPVLR